MQKINKKVLIVEDEPSYLLPLQIAFSDAGFNVATAKDGQEGFETAKKENPDIIILDILMPKMDGIAMSKKLKELNIQIPIIFLTNMSDLKHISDATETASDYIIKSHIKVEGIVDKVKERLNLE